jgi:hypothetical protein
MEEPSGASFTTIVNGRAINVVERFAWWTTFEVHCRSLSPTRSCSASSSNCKSHSVFLPQKSDALLA